MNNEQLITTNAIQWLKVAKYSVDRAHTLVAYCEEFNPVMLRRYGETAKLWFNTITDEQLDVYIYILEHSGYQGIAQVNAQMDLLVRMFDADMLEEIKHRM